MSSNHRSFGLDLMRAIAITCVIIAHFVKKLELAGFWGVELFFGLSGFLIGQILWRNFSQSSTWEFSHLRNFWSRRWWRTLPNYYLFLLINFIFYYFYNKDLLPTASQSLSYLWFGQTIIGRQGGFFGESWSLCVEEWFYLTFPLIVFLSGKAGMSKKACFILALAVLYISSALVRYILIANGLITEVRGFTFARLDAIGFGVAVAFIASITQFTYSKKLIAFLLGFLGVMSSLIYIYYHHISYNDVRGNSLLLVAVPLCFSLTLPLMSTLHRPSGVFAFFANAIEKMSFWSYSIYLCHMLILLSVYKIFEYVNAGLYETLIVKLISFVMAVIVSSFLFKYVELTFTKRRPQEFK
jgi:peptidoglycan/LPS O-acetylase OafA/YrhL